MRSNPGDVAVDCSRRARRRHGKARAMVTVKHHPQSTLVVLSRQAATKSRGSHRLQNPPPAAFSATC